ncbi:MAG: hypothetical protein KAU20_07885 [Nanoarchaeota archaeon]|nr:hypothetical protein [Nanoarchaeota archaeon]
MSNQGGMYEVLKLVDKYLELDSNETITTQEVAELTGLCIQAARNNMTRLKAAGFIERREYRDPNKRGRNVEYLIRGDAIGWIRNNLH